MGLAKGFLLVALLALCARQSGSAQDQAAEASDATPKFAPSLQVHISPATRPPNSTSALHDDTTWIERGYDLKTMIAELYDMDESRVEFADTNLASERYDVALVLPKAESEEAMDRRVQEALKKRFHLAIAVENRWVDAYVVTSPQGPGPELKPDDAGGGSVESDIVLENRVSGVGTPTDEEIARLVKEKKAATGVSLSEISVSSGTVEDFCRTLERGLNQPVVDESHLTGRYDFQVKGYENKQALFDLLRSKFGLVVTPERRQVKFLVVRTG